MAGRTRTRTGSIYGAKNRQGKPCQCKLLLDGGRCKYHGRMSTVPKTAEGKDRTLAALQAGNKA